MFPVSSYSASPSSLYHPAVSSLFGYAALNNSGTTPQQTFNIPDGVDGQSSVLLLSPDDIIKTADDFKFGTEPEPFFSEVPDPEDFLNQTKDLSTEIFNSHLQFNVGDDGNITFKDFLTVDNNSFAIPYYAFNSPIPGNAFSALVNATTLGSYIVGTENPFVTPEFWNNVPVISGYDGETYERDLVSKPFTEVGQPQSLSSEGLASLIASQTPTNSRQTTGFNSTPSNLANTGLAMYGLTTQQAAMVGETSRMLKAYGQQSGQMGSNPFSAATSSSVTGLGGLATGATSNATHTETITALTQQVNQLTGHVNQLTSLVSTLFQALTKPTTDDNA